MRLSVYLLKGIVVLIIFTFPANIHAQNMNTIKKSFSTVITKEISSDYLLFLPDSYSSQGDPHPLIVFLHGAGERGNDLERVSIHGPLKAAESMEEFPFIVAAPQAAEGEIWDVDGVLGLIDEIISEINVDVARIYLTGLSMGGFGVWDVATKEPGRFAAIAPVAGGGNPVEVCRLKHTPVWVFHGENDTVIPPMHSRELVRRLQQCEGNVRLTVYPDTGHDSWTPTYNDPAFYEWLLSHKLAY